LTDYCDAETCQKGFGQCNTEFSVHELYYRGPFLYVYLKFSYYDDQQHPIIIFLNTNAIAFTIQHASRLPFQGRMRQVLRPNQ
jgi:hypothetical protein